MAPFIKCRRSVTWTAWGWPVRRRWAAWTRPGTRVAGEGMPERLLRLGDDSPRVGAGIDRLNNQMGQQRGAWIATRYAGLPRSWIRAANALASTQPVEELRFQAETRAL